MIIERDSRDATTQELEERVHRLEATTAALEARLDVLLSTAGHTPGALPYRSPAALPAQPGAPRRDLETHLATYWLGRAGITALISGIAIFITLHFADLGAVTRVMLGYLLASVLSGAGLWLMRRYSVLGQLLVGGGLAVAYFVTYALHYIPSVRVVESELAGLGLVGLVVLGIIAVAQRARSETIAGVGLFLGFHTSIISASSFSFLATLLLAGGAMFFLVKNRWVIVPLSSVVAVYSSHLVTGELGGLDAHEPLTAAGFLILYFMVFSLALLARPDGLSPRVAVAFTLTNTLGGVVLGAREIVLVDRAYLPVFLVLMTLLCAAAAAYARRKRALLEANACAAVVTAAAALHEVCDGFWLVLAWTGLGVAVALGAARIRALSLRVSATVLLSASALLLFFVREESLLVAAAVGAGFLIVKRLDTGTGTGVLDTNISAISAAGATLALMRALSVALPATLMTLAWVLAAFILVGLGLGLRDRALRVAGLVALALGVGRLFVSDLAGLADDTRIITLVALGVVMLVMSFAYTRFRERLSHLL